MPRYAFRMRIAPGTEEEYDRRHEHVWPEMLDALRQAGYQNYSIYRDGLTLFAYFESADFLASMASISAILTARKWEAMMSDILEQGGENTPQMTPLKEVFHLDD